MRVQVKKDVGPEDGELMLDNLWSMQYRVPGPLCAFAGPVPVPKAGDADADVAGFTHGLHFRFSSPEVWAFEQGNSNNVFKFLADFVSACPTCPWACSNVIPSVMLHIAFPMRHMRAPECRIDKVNAHLVEGCKEGHIHVSFF